MPFSDAMELFNYWMGNPTLTMMIRAYLGYETKREEANPIEQAQAMKVISGGRRAQKVSTAPVEDQVRFAQLRERAKEKRAG